MQTMRQSYFMTLLFDIFAFVSNQSSQSDLVRPKFHHLIDRFPANAPLTILVMTPTASTTVGS